MPRSPTWMEDYITSSTCNSNFPTPLSIANVMSYNNLSPRYHVFLGKLSKDVKLTSYQEAMTDP